jgi:membrane protease YdiL (CAAX protease family)
VKSIARSLFLVGLLMAWNAAGDRISDRLGIETESFASPWKFPLIALGTAITCVGIVGGGVVLWGNISLRELGWTRPTVGEVVLGLAQTAICCAMIVAVYVAFGALAELGKMMTSLTLGQRVFFATMGIRNAFVEESLFRGDLFRGIDARFGTIAAVILSSVAFALFHRTLSPIPLAMKFAMGIVFALGVARTRSLIPSGLAHAVVWAIMANA